MTLVGAGIDGRTYYDLDAYVNVERLRSLHLSLCRGIAQSTGIKPLVFHPDPNWATGTQIDPAAHHLHVGARYEAQEGLPDDEEFAAIYNALPGNQQRRFLQVARNAYFNGEMIPVRSTPRGPQVHPFGTFRADGTAPSPNYQFFSEFLEYAYSELPFREIGGILLFLDYAHLPGMMHRDRFDDWYTGENHFMWLNPQGKKKFYLYNTEGQREYVRSTSAFFNIADPHGVEAHHDTTYSIRVNGQFTKEFCEQVGIKWKHRNVA